MIRCGQTDTIKTLSTVTAKNVIIWLLQGRAEGGAVSFFKGPLENSTHSCPTDLQKEREPSIEICARWLPRGLCLLGVGYSEPRTALAVTLGSVVRNDTLIRSYFSFSFWQWCLRERAQIKKNVGSEERRMRKYGFVFSDAKTQVKYIPLICSAKACTVIGRAGVQNKMDHSLACCHTGSMLMRVCLSCWGFLFFSDTKASTFLGLFVHQKSNWLLGMAIPAEFRWLILFPVNSAEPQGIFKGCAKDSWIDFTHDRLQSPNLFCWMKH